MFSDIGHLAGPTEGHVHAHAVVAFALSEDNALLAMLAEACPTGLVLGTFTSRCVAHLPEDMPDDAPEMVAARKDSEGILAAALREAANRVEHAHDGEETVSTGNVPNSEHHPAHNKARLRRIGDENDAMRELFGEDIG